MRSLRWGGQGKMKGGSTPFCSCARPKAGGSVLLEVASSLLSRLGPLGRRKERGDNLSPAHYLTQPSCVCTPSEEWVAWRGDLAHRPPSPMGQGCDITSLLSSRSHAVLSIKKSPAEFAPRPVCARGVGGFSSRWRGPG